MTSEKTLMTMDEKLIFAAAFAGALQQGRKGGFDGDPESEDGVRWLMSTAVAAAETASETVDALATVEDMIGYIEHAAEGTADSAVVEKARADLETFGLLGETIAAYRAGCDPFEEGFVDCPYDHADGDCGEHPECAVCGEENNPRADCEGCEVDCAECLCSVTADPLPKLN